MAKTKKNDSTVTINRRSSDRRENDRRHKDVIVAVDRRTEQRRKTPRRRQIDPTTCERDYSGDEIEFMQAMDAYKRTSGRMFPTCSEILEVIRGMGYVRVAQPVVSEATGEPVAIPAATEAAVDVTRDPPIAE